jgi:RNA polymerase sigma factor (sigma-70 family)
MTASYDPDRFIENTADRFHRYLTTGLGLPDDVAADIEDTAFAVVESQPDRLYDEVSKRRYLYVTGRSLAFRWKRRNPIVAFGLQDSLLEGLSEFEEEVIDKITVMQGLKRLRTRQRECVTLRYVIGLSIEETAAIMGITQGTVRGSASRGLAEIRHFMNGGDGDVVSDL